MLVRHDPFGRVDRFFDDLFRRLSTGPSAQFEVQRTGDGVQITLELPGVRPEDIELSVERNLLTVRAQRSVRGPRGQESTTFTREVLLSDGLDPDKVSASFEHGVLEIEVPARADVRPRMVDIVNRGTSASIPTSSSGTREPAGPAVEEMGMPGTQAFQPSGEMTAPVPVDEDDRRAEQPAKPAKAKRAAKAAPAAKASGAAEAPAKPVKSAGAKPVKSAGAKRATR